MSDENLNRNSNNRNSNNRNLYNGNMNNRNLNRKSEKTKWAISVAVCIGIVACVCIVLAIANVIGRSLFWDRTEQNESTMQNSVQGTVADSTVNEPGNSSVNESGTSAVDRTSGMSSRTAVNGFFMVEENGRVMIYQDDNREFYDYAEINMEDLPEDVKSSLKQGISFKDSAELYDFLQTYSS